MLEGILDSIRPESTLKWRFLRGTESVHALVKWAKISPRFPIDRHPLTGKGLLMPTKQELLDLQFIEIRHKLIEVGAFLDRIERHEARPITA